MTKHFVTFLSPGTFFHEKTVKPIESWDVAQAKRMALDIVERHNAKPFAFYFSTRAGGKDDLDSKVTNTSGNYYLGGKVDTYEEVVARNDPKEKILRWNMKFGDIKRIITNCNSYRITQPLHDRDVVLEWSINQSDGLWKQ